MPGQSRSIRVIKILEAVASADRPMRAADLMDACNLPKATVHRICGLLVERNYLRPQIGGSGLLPGHELVNLAHTTLASQAVSALRHTVLESVARKTGETCNLARPDGAVMVYWDRVEAQWPLIVQMPIGTRVPLHCSASGKLYLSSLPVKRRLQLIRKLDLVPRTPKTITCPEKLERELERIASEQVATDDEELAESMIAVAVPVKDSAGRLFATLSIHAPVFRMTLDKAKSHLELLREAAQELGSDLAGSEGDADTDPRDSATGFGLKSSGEAHRKLLSD